MKLRRNVAAVVAILVFMLCLGTYERRKDAGDRPFGDGETETDRRSQSLALPQSDRRSVKGTEGERLPDEAASKSISLSVDIYEPGYPPEITFSGGSEANIRLNIADTVSPLPPDTKDQSDLVRRGCALVADQGRGFRGFVPPEPPAAQASDEEAPDDMEAAMACYLASAAANLRTRQDTAALAAWMYGVEIRADSLDDAIVSEADARLEELVESDDPDVQAVAALWGSYMSDRVERLRTLDVSALRRKGAWGPFEEARRALSDARDLSLGGSEQQAGAAVERATGLLGAACEDRDNLPAANAMTCIELQDMQRYAQSVGVGGIPPTSPEATLTACLRDRLEGCPRGRFWFDVKQAGSELSVSGEPACFVGPIERCFRASADLYKDVTEVVVLYKANTFLH